MVPVRPVVPTVPARLSTTPAEPVVPVIGLVLLRRSFCWFMLLVPVALIDERPVASCMLLPVWLPTWPDVPAMPVPVVPVAVRPVAPAVVLVCAWTAVAPSMATVIDAPIIPLSSLFMVFS